MPCFADWIARLQRAKWLQHYQLFDARYLITLDGSRYFNSESVQCERCLTTTSRGITSYHHDILQAAIVHPDKRQVLPLAPEFVRNSDGKGSKYRKQDCELKAGYRMLGRLRADYPRMAAIIVADSLYSKQPFVERLRAARFSFLLVAKPGDHPSLYQDVAGLRRGNLLNRHHTVHRGERREYEWVTELPLNGNPNSPRHQLHPVPDYQERQAYLSETPGSPTWCPPPTTSSNWCGPRGRAGRSRTKASTPSRTTATTWSITIGHGHQHLSEAFFVLNLLAFFMHQIFDLVDGLYQRVRTFFSSRRAFWDEVRSAFRLFLFTSWDQVLVRMNSPPQPVAPRAGSIVPHPVPIRARSDFPRPDNHATLLRQGSVCAMPRQQRLAQPSPTPNRSFAPPGSFCRSAPTTTWQCRRPQTVSPGRQLPLTENYCTSIWLVDASRRSVVRPHRRAMSCQISSTQVVDASRGSVLRSHRRAHELPDFFDFFDAAG